MRYAKRFAVLVFFATCLDLLVAWHHHKPEVSESARRAVSRNAPMGLSP